MSEEGWAPRLSAASQGGVLPPLISPLLIETSEPPYQLTFPIPGVQALNALHLFSLQSALFQDMVS
jgi:hypothetical protein